MNWECAKRNLSEFACHCPVCGIAFTTILYYYCWDKDVEDLININTYMCIVPLQENLHHMYVLSMEWFLIEILVRPIYLYYGVA